MLMIARGYLVLTALIFAAVGVIGLTAPDMLATKLNLMPQNASGTAELRGLYGGGFISWALIIIAAWRNKTLTNGLLSAFAISMGSIAVVRLVSLAIDHEPTFNIPSFVTEGLMALACWVVVRSNKQAPN